MNHTKMMFFWSTTFGCYNLVVHWDHNKIFQDGHCKTTVLEVWNFRDCSITHIHFPGFSFHNSPGESFVTTLNVQLSFEHEFEDRTRIWKFMFTLLIRAFLGKSSKNSFKAILAPMMSNALGIGTPSWRLPSFKFVCGKVQATPRQPSNCLSRCRCMALVGCPLVPFPPSFFLP